MNVDFDEGWNILFLWLHKTFAIFAGVFILNLVCRDTELKKTVLSRVATVFPAVYTVDIEDEVNQIVFALPEQRDSDKDNMAAAIANVKELNSVVKRNIGQNNDIDLCDMVKNLSIVDR